MRLEKIRVSDERAYAGTPCWEWIGAKTKDGYGPHKEFYEYFIGAVPLGHEIDHLCNNRACCSPLHLEAVTHAENQRRAYKRGRKVARRSRPTHCPHDHEYTPENTRFTKQGWLQCKTCDRRRVAAYRAKIMEQNN